MPANAPLHPHDLSAPALRRVFDAAGALSVGLEEETMLLDPVTLDLLPCVGELLARVGGDPRFKRELPATQLELVTPPCAGPGEALAVLAGARRDLLAAADGLARPACAGAHPFAAAEGVLSEGPRYDALRAEYGPVAQTQLVAALQIHVAVGGAERTLAVYNGLRSLLPEIAALCANAPFRAGRDSGLASVRPTIARALPRQGVPPPLASWDELAAELRWGEAAGVVAGGRTWWWELRPHVRFGTLEVRVPDAQTTLADAAGAVAFVYALVAWLAERHDAGEPLAPAPTWRIEENRWSALRHGTAGTIADLETGERMPTRERLLQLTSALAPVAERLGCGPLLAHAIALTMRDGATRQRAVAARDGVAGLAGWLADRFAD